MLISLVRRHLSGTGGRVLLLLVLQLAATLASLYLPSLNGEIIDNGVATGDTGYIVRHGGVMLAVSVVQIVATIAATWIGAGLSATMAARLRAAVFSRVGSFSAQEVARFGAPTLISRTTNDVTQVQTVTNMALTMMVTAPMMMIGGVIMALREDIGLSWLVAVAVPLLAVSVGLVIRAMIPNFRRMQTSVDTVNRILREQITGVRVVRAFVREGSERERFEVANTEYTASAVAVGRLMSLAFPIVMVILNLSTVAVLWFGAHRIESGQMQIGALTAFMTYLMQILMSVMMATFMSMMLPRAAVSAGRIDEVLSTESSVVPPSEPRPMVEQRPPVVLEGVEFSYPGADSPVLCDVDLRAEPGRTTAIIGSTGAGKTTLLDLVPRLHDVTGGRSSSVGSTCVSRTRPCCGRASRSSRRRPSSSAGRSPPTCVRPSPMRATRSCGRRCAWRRPRTSSGLSTGVSTHPSPRSAPPSPAGSVSACPSPAPSCGGRRSTSSTTPSRRST